MQAAAAMANYQHYGHPNPLLGQIGTSNAGVQSTNVAALLMTGTNPVDINSQHRKPQLQTSTSSTKIGDNKSPNGGQGALLSNRFLFLFNFYKLQTHVMRIHTRNLRFAFYFQIGV